MSHGLVPASVTFPLERLLRWRHFPGILQWPFLIAATAVAFLATETPRHSEMNVGAALVWQFWWTLLPFFTIVAARGWCGLCPFAALGDLVQRLRLSPLPPPPLLLRRIGPWVGTASLTCLGFAFLILSLENNGRLTAALLAAFVVLVTATALLWKGRAWCRYLCPVGLLLGLYSRLAWLRLEPVGESGRRAASAGARHCPLFTSTLAPRRAQDCVLCSSCLRVPGSKSVAVRLKVPSLSSQSLPPAESATVSLLMGLLLVDALRMTPLYSRYMARAVPLLGGRYEMAMALGLVAVVVALLLLQVGLSLHGGGGKLPFWSRFGHLSLVLLPLVLVTQLALSAQHLMATGDVIRNLAAELEFVPPGHMPPTDAYTFLWPMKLLQWGMLGLGGAVSFHLSPREEDQRRRVSTVMSALVALLLLAVFVEPMSVAC